MITFLLLNPESPQGTLTCVGLEAEKIDEILVLSLLMYGEMA